MRLPDESKPVAQIGFSRLGGSDDATQRTVMGESREYVNQSFWY